MKKNTRKISAFIAAFFLWNVMTVTTIVWADGAEESLNANEIMVDGNNVDTSPANTFKGFGMVSCNGTSRLLLDYKAENPEKYWKIMNQLFNPITGMGLNHIKVELGADVNTSSAVTPATMRSADEPANVLRGADWHIVADAKKINPDITVDALRWAQPKWIDNAGTTTEEKYAARYKWYKNTIDAVYNTYGIKLDYIDPDKNETKSPESAWIKYFSQHLKSETNTPYNYGKIKIVASDQNARFELLTSMTNDEELRNAIDVIGVHYTCRGNDDLRLMNQAYDKEIWYSEAVAPCTFSEYRIQSSNPGNGLAGAGQGSIDVANHLINMYYSGDSTSAYMTRYEFQPAIGSFYGGGQYGHKEVMNASTPWSGYFYADSGVPMVRQFMNFTHKGWLYVKGACYGDGSGDNSITNTTNNYLTLTDAATGDYSMVFTNDSPEPRKYRVIVKNLAKAQNSLTVWETKGPNGGQDYDANWMKNTGNITPLVSGGGDGSYLFTYVVKPYSIATITTTQGQTEYQRDAKQTAENNTVLPLPYTDDFEYKDAKYASYKDSSVLDSSKQGYLTSRGDTPRYTTDIGGAFEINEGTDNNTLMGIIVSSTHTSGEWNAKPGNDTVLGDDRWSNYKVSIDFMLDTSGFAGIAARNLLTTGGDNPGYLLKVYKDGSYKLQKDGTVLQSGSINGFDGAIWHNEALRVVDNNITAYVDGKQLTSYTDTKSPYMSGKIGITTGYTNTQFDNLKVEPVDGRSSYVSRVDNLDSRVQYQGTWHKVASDSYNYFNRTYSSSTDGTMTYTFTGTGFNLVGNTAVAAIKVTVDGKVVESNYNVAATGNRGTSYFLRGLDKGTHTLQVTVVSGTYKIDAIEALQ